MIRNIAKQNSTQHLSNTAVIFKALWHYTVGLLTSKNGAYQHICFLSIKASHHNTCELSFWPENLLLLSMRQVRQLEQLRRRDCHKCPITWNSSRRWGRHEGRSRNLCMRYYWAVFHTVHRLHQSHFRFQLIFFWQTFEVFVQTHEETFMFIIFIFLLQQRHQCIFNRISFYPFSWQSSKLFFSCFLAWRWFFSFLPSPHCHHHGPGPCPFLLHFLKHCLLHPTVCC